MTNPKCHRQHRNERLRAELLDLLIGMPDGALIVTGAIAKQLSKKVASVSGRTIGRFLSEHEPDMVQHAGNGHWIRRRRIQ